MVDTCQYPNRYIKYFVYTAIRHLTEPQQSMALSKTAVYNIYYFANLFCHAQTDQFWEQCQTVQDKSCRCNRFICWSSYKTGTEYIHLNIFVK